ncbi:hypothetical protein IQ260_30545 [Leptolyngbya cf. ectocarpi LEGE 11479]|uniref:Uncharacterized protein n=1 Tax=Leptolyngbya cf. ectocarpi LEGE 11479 TaxID=1828722 RepID=A0A929A0N3_LEPEC|nr:hypothetical protein [Leptolyngbya ectocarpi]MBE9070980.1 hypothetical protein [Leptolyngbya cf. ectocarpi LEGE 11479]
MAVLSLKTELDVAELLLAKGWLPEEINGILVFPLPRAAFHHLSIENSHPYDSDVIKATAVTPTKLYQARQLLQSAGWLDRELESLLKPCLYSRDPWANQTVHSFESRGNYPRATNSLGWGKPPIPTMSFGHYRRIMALKRIVSLALVITLVIVAVVSFG